LGKKDQRVNTRYHKNFEEQLRRSHGVVEVVAEMFRTEGFTVWVAPLSITPSWQKRGQYSDGGADMTIAGIRTDVKGSYWNGQWIFCADYPWELVYVCPLREYNKLKTSGGLPDLWIRTNWLAGKDDYGPVTNEKVTALFGIGHKSKPFWKLRTSRMDRTDNQARRDSYWACPRWLVIPFWGICETLKHRELKDTHAKLERQAT
jgi:hypothetical protein